MKKLYIAIISLICCVAILGCGGPNKATLNVIEMIDSIGEVTVESGDSIAQAESAYDELTKSSREKVNNYDVLIHARDEYNKIVVKDVIKKISAIGHVNENSKELIDIASNAYDSLNENQKKQISNKHVLDEAKATYKKIEFGTYVPEDKETLANVSATVNEKDLQFRYEEDMATGNVKGEKRLVKTFIKNTSDKTIISANCFVSFRDQTGKHPLGSETFRIENLSPGQETWGSMDIETDYASLTYEIEFSDIKASANATNTQKTVDKNTTSWLNEEYEANFMDTDWYKEIVSIEVYTDKTCKVVTNGTNATRANVIYWLQDKSHEIKRVDLYDKNDKLISSYSGK